MGMPLSETIIDNLMAKLDSDADGAITLDEFKSALHELHDQTDYMKDFNSSWNRILPRLSGFWEDHNNEDTDAPKLDVAFQMSDIVTIETLIGEELTPSALALYTKGIMEFPLHVECAKPGHVDAWEDAFRICMKMQGAGSLRRDMCREASDRFSRIDWG